MRDLTTQLDHYLSVRRSLGHDLSTAERILRRFVAFAAIERAQYIDTELFLRWKAAFGSAGRQTWAKRLVIVRLFAKWLHGFDANHQIPPAGLVPGGIRRPKPYIYSADEISRIVMAASELPSSNGVRSLTYTTLFGLIAVTGLRISEAISLNVDDVDLVEGVIIVLRGKFNKERLIPLEDTTVQQMRAYAAERDRLVGKCLATFFVSDTGERVTDCSARYNFAVVCQMIGLRQPQRFNRHGRGPRIHDLRHSFAVHTLLGWYRAGKDPGREMIKLTTYLGHTKPANTYWYIEAIPELLELASQRAEAVLTSEVGQ